MKIAIALSMVALAAFAADPKTLPNQAGNDDVDLEGTVLIDHKDIQQALGADLEAGFVVVHIKVTPRAGHSILVSPDDFTLISRKDGDRSGALAPSQIAGSSVLVVTPGRGPGSRQSSAGCCTAGPQGGLADARVESRNTGEDNSPLMAALKSKILPDGQTKDPVEGLLYFSIEGKVKPKDLSLIYKSPFGRLEMEFK